MKARRPMTGWPVAALFCLLTSVSFPSEDTGIRQYRCAFRVNTIISAGAETPEQIAARAEELGVDVLVFSDQFIARAEWGVPGFRDVLKVVKERQSVQTYGPAAYLERMARLQEQHPGKVIIAGLDVAPYYYWEAPPLSRAPCIRHWSEQLTVIGLESPDAIRRMPVTANPDAPRRWTLTSFLRLLVVLLVPLGLVLMRRGSIRYQDEQGDSISIREPRWRALGLATAVLGVVLTVCSWPFARPAHWTQYRPTDSGEPYRAYLAWLSRQEGALAFWAHPEITHKQEISGVKLVTEPYLGHVQTVPGAAGFAAIYGDARSACRPGGAWDKTLSEHCEGRRASPLRVVGESDYHGGGGLERVETVLVLSELTRKSVMEEGFRQGYMYARARGPEGWVEVCDFSAKAPDGNGGLFLRPVRTDSAKLDIHVALRIHCPDGGSDSVKVAVITGGQLWRERTVELLGGQTETAWEETFEDDARREGRSYYRLLIEGSRMGEVVTNPIFVSRGKTE